MHFEMGIYDNINMEHMKNRGIKNDSKLLA